MISQLHHITQDNLELSHEDQARAACRGGVDWIQLRMKNADNVQWLETAVAVKVICREYGAKLIINDSLLVAMQCDADGVHLGQTDLSPTIARERWDTPGKIIGGTANTFKEMLSLAKMKVDYIGLGPYRFTLTKENLSEVLGTDGIIERSQKLHKQGYEIPVIAIGGITTEDIPEILTGDVHGIAVSSGINRADQPSLAAKNYLAAIKQNNSK